MHIAAPSHVAYPTPPRPRTLYPSPPTPCPNQPTLHLARLPCTSQAAYPRPPDPPTLYLPSSLPYPTHSNPGQVTIGVTHPPWSEEPYPPACMHIGPPPWYPRSPTLYFPTDLPYTCPQPAYPRPGHIPHTPTDLPYTSPPRSQPTRTPTHITRPTDPTPPKQPTLRTQDTPMEVRRLWGVG